MYRTRRQLRISISILEIVLEISWGSGFGPGLKLAFLPQPIPVRHPFVFSSLVLSAPEVRGARPTDLKGTVPILKFVELLKQRFGTAQRRRCSLITSAALSFRMPKAI